MRKIVLAALLATVTPALAASPEGQWSSKTVDLKVLRHAGHTYAHVEVGSKGCGGQITGEATLINHDTFDVTENKCTVHLFYYGNGKRVHITEDNCLENHGLSCEFNGTVSKN